MEGKLVIGMNVHKEICALQMIGGVAIEQEQVISLVQFLQVGTCINAHGGTPLIQPPEMWPPLEFFYLKCPNV